jgi:phosphinothricin acetyltransferase
MERIIRPAVDDDLESFAQIVNHYILTTSINFRDGAQSVEDWQATWVVLHEQYPWLVADRGGAIDGIAYATPWKLRSAYDWTVEVSVYVRDGFAGQGIGDALCRRLLELLDAQGYRAAIAVIALPNAAAVALHEALGFEHTGTMKQVGYKRGAWHDVGYWQRHHDPEGGPPRGIRPLDELEE